MAKNENDIFDHKSSKSYTGSKGNGQADIESEIDKILAEARQEKKAQKDFFTEEKLSSTESDLTNYRESQKNKAHRESSENTRKKRPHKEPATQKDRKKHSEPQAKREEKKNSKGKGLIITVAILAVLAAVAVGIYTYLSGNTKPFYPQKGNEETITTTIPIHETLAVVMVSGNEISYNGEVLTSTDELESRLNKEESLTLSLINNNAQAETYNAVATVLNKFGGSYELMNKENTNPSIDTGTSSTIASSPSAEDETEVSSSAQEVAENQQ